MTHIDGNERALCRAVVKDVIAADDSIQIVVNAVHRKDAMSVLSDAKITLHSLLEAKSCKLERVCVF